MAIDLVKLVKKELERWESELPVALWPSQLDIDLAKVHRP